MRDFQWLALAPLLCAIACGGGGDAAPGLVAESGGASSGGSGAVASGGDAAGGDAAGGAAEGGSTQGGSTQGGSGGVAGAGGSDQGGNPGSGGSGGTTAPPFPAVTDFAAKGSFATTSKGEGPSCTIFRPETLGEEGRKHPIILWGNGTTAAPPIYAGVLTHWASHGFVVAAANTSNAGTGKEMLACLDYLTDENAKSGSVYAGKLDLARVGASGHSQGGGGTIMAGADPRVSVTAPLEPYVTGLGHDPDSQKHQHGPMFLMSGGNDIIAPRPIQQQPVFDNTNADVFWGTLKNADHLISAVGDISDFRGPATAWLRLHLMDDESARPIFYGSGCSLCLSPGWTIEKKGIQ
ncbi:MAG: alpha/beta hydrolase family protein [Polyangiaceae bacterium]